MLAARLRQGRPTIPFPAPAPTLPDRFRGLPIVDAAQCRDGCRACIDACPTDAITNDARGLQLDLGRCLFCAACEDACPAGAVRFSPDYRLATRTRDDLLLRGQALQLADALEARSRR